MNRIVRAISHWWFMRGAARRFKRLDKAIKARRDMIEAARRAHKPTKHIINEQQQDMLRLLRENM